MSKPTITIATIESRRHEVNAIKSGIKLYKTNSVEFEEREDGNFFARVKDKHNNRGVSVTFSRDGCDLVQHWCHCGVGSDGDCLCKHIIAAILTIQGGIIESKITLGKTASVSTVVDTQNVAHAVGSGSLMVFATPMMIALMERAACEVLADGLEESQTSVGTQINIEHTAASPVDATITATATIDYVYGRKIKFTVTAHDNAGEVGKGTHTRVIVDEAKFIAKIEKRLNHKRE